MQTVVSSRMAVARGTICPVAVAMPKGNVPAAKVRLDHHHTYNALD